MQVVDIPACLRLERASGQEDIWTEDDFHTFLRDPKRYGLVMETSSGSVIGFLAARRLKSKTVLWSVVIESSYRRMGLGSSLFGEAWNDYPAKDWYAVVRSRDLDSQLFLKHLGFKCLETQDDAFEFPPDDGYLFVRSGVDPVPRDR